MSVIGFSLMCCHDRRRRRDPGPVSRQDYARCGRCGYDALMSTQAPSIDASALRRALARRIAYRTESQDPERAPELRAYLTDEIGPSLAALGFNWTLWDNPVAGRPPLLFAERIEDPRQPTVLMYGHGDVVLGYDAQWRQAASPWTLQEHGNRWYGRGSADNKGQHSINLAAIEHLLRTRGALGCNIKWLFEMGEEVGSPGLRATCEARRNERAADVLIASDGPRLRSDLPTLFLGSRGAFNFVLDCNLRDGGHHSGNWGGLLANPGTILAHAIASLVDARGAIQVAGLRPAPIPASVRRALATIEPGEPGGPAIDVDWGEPGLSPAERVFGFNALEVLAFKTGNPENPVNAIPGRATAHLQLRFVAGCDHTTFLPLLREHLDAHGFARVAVSPARSEVMDATRLDPDSPWVRWAAASIERTVGIRPAILPNLGGSLPNDCFAHVLGLPTLWIPHSYPACSQHAPDEHLLADVAVQGVAIMAGLLADLGRAPPRQ
jgi:acetylornithine deacetylase/succinyl-diaminopimelate desuccinylase-like protein